MKLSQISSHYAGMLKAHSASQEQTFAWEAMMTMANILENMEKEIANLHKKIANLDDRTIGSQRIT